MIQKTFTIECHLHIDKDNGNPSIYHHLVTEFLTSTFFQIVLHFDHTCQFGRAKTADSFGGKFACFEDENRFFKIFDELTF